MQVPSSFFVARRNGQAFITGNSGFPKGLDVSKAIDKAAGAEREVVGDNPNWRDEKSDIYNNPINADEPAKLTTPATPEAEAWDGWKTVLKPATEFIVLARKPLAEDTVDANVLEYGTGALNIDGCLIENEIDEVTTTTRTSERNQNAYHEAERSDIANASPEGRYPANVVFDEAEAEALDREVGESEGTIREPTGNSNLYNGKTLHDADTKDKGVRGFNDFGGPSRYFYTSKATRSERTLDGKIENAHPTVKPVDLMEWLVKLVTAEEQTVLDLFCGTGTTLLAAKNLNRKFVGIEKSSQWADVARARSGLTPENPDMLTEDGQSTLAALTDGGA